MRYFVPSFSSSAMLMGWGGQLAKGDLDGGVLHAVGDYGDAFGVEAVHHC